MTLKDKAAAAVDQALGRISEGSPGCAIGVVADGETLVTGCRGLANLELRAPITPSSRFYLASVSKQVTAMAVLLAVEAGQLDLDSSIRKVIAELPSYMDDVTVRRLLEHTSGIRDYFSLGFLGGLSPEHVFTETDVLELVGRQQALNFAPGTDILYSNSGYVLLSIAVARATGKPLDGFAREAIFEPLGMAASRFQHDHALIVPDKASGYQQRGDEWLTANSMLDVVGDGGMYASLEDMLAWTRNLLSPRVGADAISQMKAPVSLLSGGPTGYGMGLGVGAHRGLAIVEHGGGLAGYRTQLLAYPTEGFGVVVLCNDAAASPAQIAGEVAEACLSERMTPASVTAPDIAIERVRARAGLYRSADKDLLRLNERDGKLFITGLPSPLHMLGPDVYALDDLHGVAMTFEAADAAFVLSHAGGPTRRFASCGTPADVSDDGYAGAYQSAEIAAPCTVSRIASGLAATFARQQPAILLAIAPDCLWAANLGVTLTFERDDDGAVRGFTIDGARLRGVAFSRRV